MNIVVPSDDWLERDDVFTRPLTNPAAAVLPFPLSLALLALASRAMSDGAACWCLTIAGSREGPSREGPAASTKDGCPIRSSTGPRVAAEDDRRAVSARDVGFMASSDGVCMIFSSLCLSSCTVCEDEAADFLASRAAARLARRASCAAKSG